MNKPRGIRLAGNWKMFHTQAETRQFFRSFQSQSSILQPGHLKAIESKHLRIIFFPPLLSLAAGLDEIHKATFPLRQAEIGAQNAHWEMSGAFTGEVSGAMLQELSISWILVGHSERRQYFGESNESCQKKILSFLQQGFKILYCVGETQKQREKGQTYDILTEQLSTALPVELSSIPGVETGDRLAIAYEPVWAIGTGLTATPEQAEDAHQFIRKFLWDRFGMKMAGQLPVLYGGSVKTDNLQSLIQKPNIDGALVGGASLKPDGFLKLISTAAELLEA